MKFVFVLLAIALVSGAQSASVQSEVQEVQSKIQQRVQSLINELKKAYEAAKEKAFKIRDELVAKSKEFFGKSEAQMREHFEKMRANFADLWKRAGKVNISQCKTVAQTFMDMGKNLLETAKTCVDHTLDLGKEYVKLLENLKENVPASMSAFSEKAQQCFDKKSERRDSDGIIVCLKKLGEEYSEIASDTASVISQIVAKLGALVGDVAVTVSDKLPKCMASQGMEEVKKSSVSIMKEVETCVKNNIAAVSARK